MNGFDDYYDMLRRVLEFGVPFTNHEEVTKLREVQQHGFDADEIIRDRRRAIEEVLCGKPSRLPHSIQQGLRVVVHRHKLPRALVGPIQWCVSRREMLPGMRVLPVAVIRIIIDFTVTPDLPGLEGAHGGAPDI